MTLLLADVEASTALWTRDSARARRAMSDLDAVVDELVAKLEGARPLEQGEGDSFVAGFARASDAVACTLEIQRRLVDEPLRIRMGLHTGEIDLREGRYDGPTIIRAARLRDLAHGGQVLLSSATRDLVQDVMPEGADLIDLGSHRLKGLDRPERVYQLVHPALDGRFPPLRSSVEKPGNLPVRITSFVGRNQELSEVVELCSTNRIVTLTGAGGVGKTRLAIEGATRVAETFPDGVWFCDLGPLSDPDAVPQTLRSVLGVREELSRTDLETVCARLSGAHALVVLDNCEHLVESSADVTHALVASCPGVHVLITSREPIGVEGEVAWRVPSLGAPQNGGEVDPDALVGFDAVRLFVERAAQARSGFALTRENAEAIKEICARLDGIPLAIELAAARVRVLSVRDLADGLHDRFRLLGRGSRTVLARQQTLEASVAWSHDMLSASQKAVFRRLAVFAGSFTLEGAEHVVTANDVRPSEVLELLSQLVDRSLVVAAESEDGTRYRLLETIRQYARERLIDSGEAVEVGARHLTFHVDWMERLVQQAEVGGSHVLEAAQRRVDAAYDNIREACEWAIAYKSKELGIKLASSLFEYWFLRFGMTTDTKTREARRWLEHLFGDGRDTTITAHTRARAYFALAQAAVWIGDVVPILDLTRASVDIAREAGDPKVLARNLLSYGYVQGFGDAEAGLRYLEESAELARSWSYAAILWQALYFISQLTLFCGSRALAASREGLEAADHADLAADPLRAGFGFAMIQAGAISDGLREMEEALASFEALNETSWRSRVSVLRAFGVLMQGDARTARALAEHAVELAREDAPERELAMGQAQFFLALIALEDGRYGEVDEHLRRLGEHELINVFAGPGLVMSLRSLLCAAEGKAVSRAELHEAADTLALIVFPVVKVIGLWTCARAARHLGEYALAESLIGDALALIADDGPTILAPDVIDVAAALRGDVSADADAARLFGAADAARERMGMARRDLALWDIADEMRRPRERMGDDAFDEAVAEGTALSLEDALAYALRGRGARQRPVSGWDSLTPTELKVVDLVSEGLTNPQVGERLFISKRTAAAHLRSIFGKLGVSTRAELAAEATKRVPPT